MAARIFNPFTVPAPRMIPWPRTVALMLLLALSSGAWAADAGQAGQDLPDTPGHHRLRFTAHLDGKPMEMAYSIFLPRTYRGRGGNKPLLVFMMGLGERGTDHTLIFLHGPQAELSRNPQLEEKLDMIILSPQCPPGRTWYEPQMIQAVLQLMDFVETNWRVDPNREYATGLSMGGKGTWLLALAAPERFAAIAPLCAVAVEPEKAAQLLKHTAVWVIVGGNDGAYTEGSRQMADAIRKAGGDATLSEVPSNDHGIWVRFYPQKQFYEWFLFNVKGKPASQFRFTPKEMLAIGANPPGNPKLTADFQAFTKWWTLINCGGGNPEPGLLDSTFKGRQRVFVTHPLNDMIPCLMQTTWSIPASGKASLDLVVSSAPQGAWKLIVQANGKQVLVQDVNAETTKNRWLRTHVDLTPYAGTDVRLEIVNAANGNPNPTAYWGQVLVVFQ